MRVRHAFLTALLVLATTWDHLPLPQVGFERSPAGWASRLDCLRQTMLRRIYGRVFPSSAELARFEAMVAHIESLRAGTAYPQVPDLDELSLVTLPARAVAISREASAGVTDPILEQARIAGAYPDFKHVSDLKPRALDPGAKQKLHRRAEQARAAAGGGADGERAFLKTWIDGAYEAGDDFVPAVTTIGRPRWRIQSGDSRVDAAFAYAENTWSKLLRVLSPRAGSSALGTPYPTLIPGGRFSEYYNWDLFFGVEGALATGRLELAQMQVENLLSSVRKFGFVPNGGRDYYLTRSQPPLLSSMTRNVFEASLAEARSNAAKIARLREWLHRRALPLLEGEYRDFWMNPATRYDAKTGLNHHWDAVNLPRPERFGADDEKRLGRTYRDVRAGAESGEDFTETHEGEATQIASVLLNSVLGKVEADLAWMAEQLGDDAKSAFYREARRKRIDAMNRYLWDPQTGFYYNYHLRERRPVAVVSGNTFAPLFAELASPEQAAALRSAGAALEGPGGIRASLAPRSPHQWDGSNGWAPYQYFAIQGLSQYGYVDDSRRIARKWVEALTRVFHNEGTMIERVDVDRVAAPIDDGSKYAPQPDFLWSIATFEWCVIKILRTPTRKAAH